MIIRTTATAAVVIVTRITAVVGAWIIWTLIYSRDELISRS
jgi:hypothetical protein